MVKIDQLLKQEKNKKIKKLKKKIKNRKFLKNHFLEIAIFLYKKHKCNTNVIRIQQTLGSTIEYQKKYKSRQKDNKDKSTEMKRKTAGGYIKKEHILLKKIY